MAISVISQISLNYEEWQFTDQISIKLIIHFPKDVNVKTIVSIYFILGKRKKAVIDFHKYKKRIFACTVLSSTHYPALLLKTSDVSFSSHNIRFL